MCGQVALQNQCLPQTDTFLKAAISLLPDLPPTLSVPKRHPHYAGHGGSLVVAATSGNAEAAQAG